MPRTTNNNTNSNVTARKNTAGSTLKSENKTGSNKKQEPVIIKVPTARQRAKEFDEGRRHDAESNEL
jgi:hypothetical protein